MGNKARFRLNNNQERDREIWKFLHTEGFANENIGAVPLPQTLFMQHKLSLKEISLISHVILDISGLII